MHRLDQSPDYPMQLMIGVFDFPGSMTSAGRDGTGPGTDRLSYSGHAV